jgi:hypothetical protein
MIIDNLLPELAMLEAKNGAVFHSINGHVGARRALHLSRGHWRRHVEKRARMRRRRDLSEAKREQREPGGEWVANAFHAGIIKAMRKTGMSGDTTSSPARPARFRNAMCWDRHGRDAHLRL